MIEYINTEFNKIYNWFSKNELIIITSETYFRIFKNININIDIKSYKFFFE